MQKRRRQAEAWDRLFGELCAVDRRALIQMMRQMIEKPARVWVYIQLAANPLILG